VRKHFFFAEGKGQPCRGVEVHYASSAGGDDGVDQQDGGEPAGADGEDNRVVRAEVVLAD
jgi:hypothetical protein